MNLFAVAKIVGCFGIKGFVKVQLLTHSTPRLNKLRNIFIGISENTAVPAVVEEIVFNRNPALVKLQDVNDRTSAEKITGKFLFVDEQNVAVPPKGSYFIHEIIGYEVWSETDVYVGILADVYKLPAQDVWVVEKDGKQFMIPAVKDFIKVVDAEKHKIIITVIEGLIEE